MKTKQKLFVVVTLAALITSLSFFHGCDMEYINPVFGNYEGVVPHLTILSLPKYTLPHHLSSIYIYNNAGVIAKCPDYNDIIITNDSRSATAKIPLVYENNTLFHDTGTYYISFSMYGDIFSQIVKLRGDRCTVFVVDGSGIFDLADDFGYFSGGLVNPDDYNAPVIKRGTIFEMNGSYYDINADTPVNQGSFNKTCLVYVYASLRVGDIEFEYSLTPPVYDNYKRAYYSEDGTKRALYFFVYIPDSSNNYISKTFVSDSFKNLSYSTLVYADITTSTSATQNLETIFSLSGDGNPEPQTISLSPGTYIFVLTGAGGGGVQTHGGGTGGFISEIVTVTQETEFLVYTGQKGENGTNNMISNNKDYYWSASGGGGGAGTFIYSPDGYFLCAGGGGGASGEEGHWVTIVGQWRDGKAPGGGGAGGAVGPGAPGYYGLGAASPPPGPGGGYGNVYVGNSSSIINVSGFHYGFASGGYSAAYYKLAPPLDWLNTNNANGQGAYSSSSGNGIAGGAGGNNRNLTRGGGSSGSGSIMIYKVF